MAKSALKSSKLHYHLSFFSPKEAEAFKSWIEIPLFNTEKRLRTFCDAFFQWVMHPEAGEISRKELFEKTLPGQEYDPRELKKMMTGLTNLAIEFLTLCEFRHDKHAGDRSGYLLKAFNQREMDKYFDSTFNRERAKMDAVGYGDVMHNHHQLEMEHEYNLYQNSLPRGKGKSRIGNILASLDIYYLGRRLKHTCAKLNSEINSQKTHGTTTSTPSVNTFEKAMVEVLAAETEFLPPPILIYYLVYKTLVEPTVPHHFQDLKTALKLHAKEFPKAVASEMYNYAVNYSVRKFQNGNVDFLEETSGLYEQQFRDEIIEAKSVNVALFKNIVTVQARTGHFSQVEQLINDFSEAHSDAKSLETINFCNALLLFYQKEYREAKKAFASHLSVHEDFFFGASGRAYICKCCAELEEYEELNREMVGLDKYLQKWAAQYPKFQSYYSAFTSALRKISQALEGNPDQKTERLISIRENLDRTFHNPTTLWVLRFLKDKLG